MLTRRFLPAALAFSLLFISAVAFGAADLHKGKQALRAAYEQTEGDEGGFGGTLVEQCRLDGDDAVRCVVVDANGNSDLDTQDYSETRAPRDFGIARFSPDGTPTTSREPFAQAPVPLDADIRVARRLRRTKLGRIAIRVAPDVPSTVTVRGWFGDGKINRRPTRSRTVSVSGGQSVLVALDLTKAQRRRIREALARKGSIRAVIFVRVIGDVGPADATEIRYADVRVVR